jgi:hypothetical protein
MASFTIGRKCGVRGDRARLSSCLHLHGWPRVASSVTDNFGNRDNCRAGERRSTRKSKSSLIWWGRSDTQAVTIPSVTEVIEVIGYQLWRGVLWRPSRHGVRSGQGRLRILQM